MKEAENLIFFLKKKLRKEKEEVLAWSTKTHEIISVPKGEIFQLHM